MTPSNLRGARIPQLVPVPSNWAQLPALEKQRYLEEAHAAIFREIKRLIAALL